MCSDQKYKEYIDGNCNIVSLVKKNRDLLNGDEIIDLNAQKL